jgi:hypothetical protein
MNLDKFDAAVLDEHGDPQDILKKIYNVGISLNQAKKYMAGIRMHLRHKANMHGDVQTSEMEEVTIKADGSRTTTRMVMLSEEDNQSPTRVMSLMGYDPLQWELISCKSRRNYWDTTTKDKAGVANKSTNHAYMVTLTVKPIQFAITVDTIREALEDLPSFKMPEYKYKPGGMMLELPILDFHLGKLAWKDETGQDYDLKIAEQLYRDTVLDILTRVKAYGMAIERIIYPIGQDYFHVDTIGNTTTAGTPLDTDTRWEKMYKKGIELLIWTIEQLRAIAPVECMYVAGNHDKMLSYCATITLDAYYRNLKGVRVDVSPTTRKYIQYGKCLIGYSHGKEEGKRIETIMQVEQPEAWGKSEYREWHLGDLHHEEARESGGIITRRLSAITATDAWHAEKAFVGAVQKAQAFVWDKERGLQLVINSVVRKDGE